MLYALIHESRKRLTMSVDHLLTNKAGNSGMNWNIPTDQSVNALIAVAHPDDEIIFSFGTMLYYPNWNWIVVTFTWSEYSERIQEFKRAMAYLRSLGISIETCLTLGQADTGNDLSNDEIKVWKSAIQEKRFAPTLVLTHNTEGEYGHTHHKSVNRIIHQLFSNVWEFICPGAKIVNPQPTKTYINEVPLNNVTLDQKRYIFNCFYTSESYLWNTLPDVMEYEFTKGPEIFTSD